MNRSMQMIVCLTAALGAGSAFAQTHDDSTPTFTTEPHVYVSTTNGINLYYAAATGVPSLVSGSPFQTTQPMIGSNGSYLLTLDNSDYDKRITKPPWPPLELLHAKNPAVWLAAG
jgi:hypothetical protein